jgi:hypothetical protein
MVSCSWSLEKSLFVLSCSVFQKGKPFILDKENVTLLYYVMSLYYNCYLFTYSISTGSHTYVESCDTNYGHSL